MQPLACKGRADLETQFSGSQFQKPLHASINTICKDETRLPQEEEKAGRTLTGKPIPAVGRGPTLLIGRDGAGAGLAMLCGRDVPWLRAAINWH